MLNPSARGCVDLSLKLERHMVALIEVERGGGRARHQLNFANIDLLILFVSHLLMHQYFGGCIVDASILWRLNC